MAGKEEERGVSAATLTRAAEPNPARRNPAMRHGDWEGTGTGERGPRDFHRNGLDGFLHSGVTRETGHAESSSDPTQE